MKRNIKQALCIFVFVIAVGFTAKAPRNEKQLTVTLPQAAWQQIVEIVDNAPLAGEVRKPLLNAIITQLNKQLADTTKQKK